MLAVPLQQLVPVTQTSHIHQPVTSREFSGYSHGTTASLPRQSHPKPILYAEADGNNRQTGENPNEPQHKHSALTVAANEVLETAQRLGTQQVGGTIPFEFLCCLSLIAGLNHRHVPFRHIDGRVLARKVVRCPLGLTLGYKRDILNETGNNNKRYPHATIKFGWLSRHFVFRAKIFLFSQIHNPV
jgi:hypothetical protein